MTDTLKSAGGGEVKTLLNQALDRLNRGDSLGADSMLQHVLATHPANAEALQLLGVLRRAHGQFEEAEDLYRRSLALVPSQPHVQYNLGNLLLSLSRLDDAIEHLREAVRLEPRYFEAQLSLGIALQTKGAHAESEECFRSALRLRPNNPLALQCLGALLNDMEKPQEAEKIFRRALAPRLSDPRQEAALNHNLGVSLNLQGRFEEALRKLDLAKAQVPDMPKVDYNRGNALQGKGDLEAAVNAYRSAIGRNPVDMLAHEDLNQLLYRMGDDNSFLKSYEDAMRFYPDAGALPLSRANFLFFKGDFEKARDDYERAARLLPGVVTPHDGLGLVLARLSQFDEAIHAHETAVQMEPDNAHAWRNFAETLLRAGDAKKGVETVEKALAIGPTDQGSLAIWGTALRMLSDPREKTLNDYEKFVQTFDIEPPEGFSSIEDFNAELNSHLDSVHSDTREIIDQTLRQGTQSFGNLFSQGRDLVDRLRKRIDEAVAAYIDRMNPDEVHPLLSRRRADFDYAASWSVRLRDCGYHTNHYHNKGWISSAYYVSLPSAAEDVKAQAGWLKLGEPGFPVPGGQPVRTVQPKSGRLVLFPSYMWHGTIPFSSQQSRTAIAFDVVPR